MSTQYASVTAAGGEGQANINIWLQDISPWVPGAHRSVVKRQLILAMREFFEKSWAWRAALGPMNITPNQNTYMLGPFNSTADVVGVIGVYVNGVPIAPMSQAPANDGQATPIVPTSDMPSGYYMVRPDVLVLYPTPAIALTQALQVQCALRPKLTVNQVPSIAVTNFYEAIMQGALYRLLGQPAKPYSNPQLSAYFETKFRTEIGVQAGLAKKGFNRGASWTFPYFGSGRSSFR